MANISRDTFDPNKNYQKVILQQKVPFIDADFNEAQDNLRFLISKIASVIESYSDGGFFVEGTGLSNDFVIRSGFLVYNGYVMYKSSDENYSAQNTNPLTTPTADRTDVIGLHIYFSEITPNDDPNIIDPTLNTESAWRLKLNAVVEVYEGGSLPDNTSTDIYLQLGVIHRTAGKDIIDAGDIDCYIVPNRVNFISEIRTSKIKYKMVISDFIAGETLVYGDVVYYNSDGMVYKANATNSLKVPAIAISLGDLNAGQLGPFVLVGLFYNPAWNFTTIGGNVFLDVVDGAITQTAPSSSGNQIQKLGIAISNNIILFNPSADVFEVA